jgi:predicted methyltransferase
MKVVLAHFLKPGGMLIIIDFRAGPKPLSDNQKLFEE